MLFLLVSVVGGLPPARQRLEKPRQASRNPAMQLGKSPEQKQDPNSMRTARRHDHGHERRQAAPPAAQAGGAEDRSSLGTMHSRRTRPSWTADRPPPQTTGTQAPPAPPRSTAAPRTRRPATIPAPAAGPPHGPPRPHRARTADAPPRRPTTSPTPPRTPDSGPRWTGGPAAYGYRLLLYLYA